MLTTWAHSQAVTRIPAPPLFPPHTQLWRESPAVIEMRCEAWDHVHSVFHFLVGTPVGLIDLFLVARAGRHTEAALAEFLFHGHVCQQGPEEVFWRGFLACRLELRCSWLLDSSVLKPRGWAHWNFSPLPPSSWWRFLQWVLADSPQPRTLSLTTHRKIQCPPYFLVLTLETGTRPQPFLLFPVCSSPWNTHTIQTLPCQKYQTQCNEPTRSETDFHEALPIPQLSLRYTLNRWFCLRHFIPLDFHSLNIQ